MKMQIKLKKALATVVPLALLHQAPERVGEGQQLLQLQRRNGREPLATAERSFSFLRTT